MRRRRSVRFPLVASATLLAGCGASLRPAAMPAAGEQRPTVSASGTAPATPAAATPQAPPELAGTWSLRAQGQTRRGPMLELTLDSLAGSTFRVRVAFLMQGDVGIEPSQFEPTVGRVSPGGRVHLTVKARGQEDPMGQMVGALARDTIRLHAYRWAGEDQTARGTRWLLVRQP